MIFQHSSEIAIRATLVLAQQAPGKLSPVHEIAVQAGVSKAYLAKIIQRLSSAGLVRSFRGPGKGIELGHAPEEITLASVVHALQGTFEETTCVLGIGACTKDNPCALHHEWGPIRSAILDMLQKITLADLVASIRKRSVESQESSQATVAILSAGSGKGR